MIHCKACDAPMSDREVETENDGMQQEILCPECITKAQQARDHDQYWYEGLWWNMHWPGREYHEDIA